MFTTTWRNKIQAFELSTSDWVQERPSEVLGAEHVRWVKSSDPDSEAAGPRVNGWIDGWTDAKATAEQVKRERSSLTCQNDVYCGENGTILSCRQTAGHNASLISNQKILDSEKLWIWLGRVTDALSHILQRKLVYPSAQEVREYSWFSQCASERTVLLCFWGLAPRYDVQCPTFLQLFDRAHNEANLHQLKKEKKVSLGTTTPIFM